MKGKENRRTRKHDTVKQAAEGKEEKRKEQRKQNHHHANKM